jgi:uncharacterized membrane protein (UPF0182 family)
MRDLPPKSEYGLTIKNPGIYYGLGKYPYSVVPNNIGEIDYPREETNVKGTYVGKGGVALSSMMRKFLFSFYFEDKNIFFTPDTVPDSRILFVRNIIDRIKKITPFLELDSDPYIVSTEEGVFWVQDAYTVSDRYPNAQPYEGRFNYIRNAVKIVVDAYHGTVSFYLADRKDPIAAAYGRIYPGLFKPIKEMPAGLKRHLRYPKDLFEIQMEIYARYHQTDPGTFFRQEDSWEICRLVRGGEPVKMRPYYLTTNLLEAAQHEFVLAATMSPLGRNNLRALAIAGCDPGHYGKMKVYSFPKGQQVYGPSQVDALIDQDTEIAQQLTLWDQAGSEVIRGRMIMLPVNGMILYIEPIYLSSSTRLKIPELKRLVVSQGNIVAMASSLEEAFEKLDDKLNERKRRKQERFQKVLPPPIEKTPPSRLGDDPAGDSPPSEDGKPPETAGDSAHA